MNEFFTIVWEYRREIFFLLVFLVSTFIWITRSIRNRYRRKKYQLPCDMMALYSMTSGMGCLILGVIRYIITA